MTKKRPQPQIISSLDLFCRAPSSDGLLHLLDDISRRVIILDDEARKRLKITSEKDFVFNSESFFQFNRAIWESLLDSDLHIDWYDRYFSSQDIEVDKEQSQPNSHDASTSIVRQEPSDEEKPLTSKMAEVGYQFAGLIDQKNKDVQDSRDVTTNQLAFFSQVNRFFLSEGEFSQYVEKSRELETFLISLCVNEKVKTGLHGERWLSPEDWLWTTQSIISCFIAFHRAKRDDHSSGHEELVASFVVSAAQTLILGCTSWVAGHPPNPSLIAKLCEQEKPGVDIQQIRQLLKHLQNATTIESVCMWMQANTLTAPVSRLTTESFWRFLLRAWMKYAFHPSETDISNDFIRLAYTLPQCAALLLFENDNNKVSNWLAKGNQEVDLEKISEILKHEQIGRCLTTRLSCELLREIRDFDEFGLDSRGLQFVAEHLVELSEKSFESSGFPTNIPFVTNIQQAFADELYIRKRSVFYNSVSTLAINLAEEEYSPDHFDCDNSSTCYLNAARCIAKAGYREHAAVFLSYAFFRSTFIVRAEVSEWSIRELDNFIRSELSTQLIRRYLLPMLQLVTKETIHQKYHLQPAFLMWIGSLTAEYGAPTAPPLRVIPGSFSNPKTKVPVWFGTPSEQVISAISNLQQALGRDRHTDDSWRHAKERYRVRQSIADIQIQLEAEIRDWFASAYTFFYAKKEFQDLFLALTAEKRQKLYSSGQAPSLGWIEIFLRHSVFIVDKKRDTAEFEGYCRAAKECVGLKDLLLNLQGKSELIKKFQQFIQIDNEKSTHGQPSRVIAIRQADGSRKTSADLISYEDADFVYKYALTDFRRLYDCLSPIVRIDRS